jgi:hypothetical protein
MDASGSTSITPDGSTTTAGTERKSSYTDVGGAAAAG